jgi:hypothetical protein
MHEGITWSTFRFSFALHGPPETEIPSPLENGVPFSFPLPPKTTRFHLRFAKFPFALDFSEKIENLSLHFHHGVHWRALHAPYTHAGTTTCRIQNNVPGSSGFRMYTDQLGTRMGMHGVWSYGAAVAEARMFP